MTGISVETPVPHVALITLSRPPVNALDTATRRALVTTMDRLQVEDDVRAIVITGSGSVFCAGADVKEKARLNESGANMIEANRLTRSLFFSFIDSAKPIIAAVNGPALGAGLVLLACCDVLISADDAVYAMPEIDVGQGGGASFLRRILPTMLMRKMMLTGERVPAAELHRHGVLDRCLPREDVLPASLELATTIAAKSPTAVRAIRDSFATVEELSLSRAFHVEQRYTTELGASADGVEARRAFIEKRAPSFPSHRPSASHQEGKIS